MPSQGFIDVRVLVDDQPLLEYFDPDSEVSDDHQVTRYVEVRAGQKFRVEVTLLPGFHFQRANYVKATLKIDHQRDHQFSCWSYQDVKGRRGEVQDSQTTNYGGVRCRSPTTGRWFMADYEFGALGISKPFIPAITWQI